MIEDYNPAENSPRNRRNVLTRAIKFRGVESVKRSLQIRKGKAQGYKIDRIRSDLNWLKDKHGESSNSIPFI